MWNEILAMPQPDAAMKTATVFWHFGRGMALAGTGKVSEAEAEYKIVSEAEAGDSSGCDLPDADQQQNQRHPEDCGGCSGGEDRGGEKG